MPKTVSDSPSLAITCSEPVTSSSLPTMIATSEPTNRAADRQRPSPSASSSISATSPLARMSSPRLLRKIRTTIDRTNPASRIAPSARDRSEEHTSELQSLMRISYAVICLKKKKQATYTSNHKTTTTNTTKQRST